MKLKAICMVLGLALWQTPTHANVPSWNLNDVSYLFSLPNDQSLTPNDLLGPKDSGAYGELLPQEDFDRIPTLLNNGNGNATLYAGALKVVSVRIDPCPNGATPCSPEVRLIWQPIERDSDSSLWTARDGTVHSFYRLPEDQFRRLIKELWSLKIRNLGTGVDTHRQPLGIHPALLDGTTRTAFGKDVKQAILASCGSRNLYKITFMSLLVPATWWRFGGFEKSDQGRWTAVSIPRLASPLVDIFNSATEQGGLAGVPGKEMDAIFNVLPANYPEDDDLFPVINKSFRNNDASDEPVFLSKLNAVARFQNPHRTNPSNLDCASCHFANATRFYSVQRFPALAAHLSTDQYQNPEPAAFRLDNLTVGAAATRVMRAFGYFNNEPALIQRVINDSAESAHWLNTHP